MYATLKSFLYVYFAQPIHQSHPTGFWQTSFTKMKKTILIVKIKISWRQELTVTMWQLIVMA